MTQVAMSMVLLTAAGLLVESLRNLQSVNAGIGVENVMTAEITVGPAHYPNAESRQQFFDTLMKRLRQMPGVTAVAIADTVPPSGFVHSRMLSSVQVVGRPAQESGGNTRGIVAWRRVSPEYFAALGIPMLQGQGFREEQRTRAENVVVMSRSLARKVLRGESGIGRQVYLSDDPQDRQPATGIGICGDVPNDGLSRMPDPEYYLLRKQITDTEEGRGTAMVGRSLHGYDGEQFVVVRSIARPQAVAGWIKGESEALDRTVPVTMSTMEHRMNAVSERPRFSAVLLSLFALLGVALAAGGLYGLTTFLVVQQTRELGVRIAVGATPRQIVDLILGQALRWTAGGIIIGFVGAATAGRLLRSMLFQVHAENFGLFGAAALLMMIVAVTAALAHSLRAARIDPVIALRND